MKLIARIVVFFGVFGALMASQSAESLVNGEEARNLTDGEKKWHELHKYFREPPSFDEPRLHNIVLMCTFFITALCSIAALVLAWLSFRDVYFGTIRELLRLEEKVKLGMDFTARRKFPDDVVERLSYVANFDMATNREEISTMLKSLGPAPGGRSPF